MASRKHSNERGGKLFTIIYRVTFINHHKPGKMLPKKADKANILETKPIEQ